MSFAEDMGHDIPHYDDMYQSVSITTIDCTIKASTDKAMLIEVIEGATSKKLTTWVPKSKCQYNANTKSVDIPDWLYSKLNFK
tara:strand:- start:15103 stop:15351 length:249 start_codon:yes stop_codon:yes gene_type:complete